MPATWQAEAREPGSEQEKAPGVTTRLAELEAQVAAAQVIIVCVLGIITMISLVGNCPRALLKS